ncbi:unnamed protein product [Parnassius apollo]|uniref:Regulatory protein zeste n=1 Tax=Parnassius apollo TaxID=110799 RepID=A0A8S3XZN5_PARAO|nr:unnamed protein product [Parnassius apollo]
MKTSSSQFDLMVTFMEQHGDLSKPSYNARGRIASLKNWEKLAQLLNSDGSGGTKSTEKWKKVWSDYKNNTKKKAARLHKAAKGTGGGPAIHGKLTDLEQRVLNLIGVQVATDLTVEEAGLSQVIYVQGNPIVNIEQGITLPQPHHLVECSSQPGQENVASLLPPSHPRAISSPPLAFAKEEVQNTGMLFPTMPLSQVQEIQPGPALSGQTTSHHARPIRSQRSHRRRVRHTEQVAQQFLQAKEYWRNLKSQQHQDFMDMRREQNRIRELEVQAQREWQALGLRALDILDKLVSKYCKD